MKYKSVVAFVGLNSVRHEILSSSSVTIVFYDKVRGRNKAKEVTFGLLGIFHLKKIQSDTFSQDNIMAYTFRPKKIICVFPITWSSKLESVGRDF